MVTLTGSPQVWHKLGDLISAVQHKAQIIFLSRVLNPETGDTEAEPTPSVQNVDNASCPDSAPGSVLAQMQDDSMEPRTTSVRKARTERDAPRASAGSETVAFKHTDKNQYVYSLSRIENLALEPQNHLTLHRVAAIPSDLAASESDIVEVVLLPQKDSIAPLVLDNPNLEFKLRRVLDENKVSRQRTRLLIGRPVLALPASKTDAVSSERAG